MRLTEHQNEKLTQAMTILQSSDRLLIKGSAGVGKTTLADELIRRIRNSPMKRIFQKALCSAPTNKAVAVIKNKVMEHDDLTFSTTHSALKLKRNVNKKTGDVSFEPWFNEKYPPLKGLYLMVVDEASMLNTSLMNYIEEYATRFNVKVVFLGDDKQLNPVGEENSPVFFQGYPEVELTEIIRQGAGNPIIDLSRNMMMIWDKQPRLIEGRGFDFGVTRSKIIEDLAEVNGTDEMKYLAWTNKDVDNMNFFVREHIYGTPNMIEIGETLIFNAPFGEDYFTNEEIKVETLEVRMIKEDVLVKNNPVTKETETREAEMKVYIINGNVRVVHENSVQIFNKICKDLFFNCKKGILDWKSKFKFEESFADMKYNHAITVHKSQGSTYKNTVLNVKNLALNQSPNEKERLFYTGITRASDLLILYNV